MRKPDFERNTLRALRREKPERPSLFELFFNWDYYQRLAGRTVENPNVLETLHVVVDAFSNAGYDYATASASSFSFAHRQKARQQTISLNDGATITNWQDYEKYTWNRPGDYDTSRLKEIEKYLPQGMKLMVIGPGGVLENLIELTGYDNLCMMLYDEPGLVKELTDHIGQALLAYYEEAAGYESVGFLCANDDWGFNTQTFLSTGDMRKYIFPWHKRIVEIAHRHGKPCILHSCGYFDNIIEDVIEGMGFDGRHSYEDNICPVEIAYERFAGRITVMGGIDMGFMVQKTPKEIFDRAIAMLNRAASRGGYLLGTGNSVPPYVPFENHMALLRAAEAFKE